MCHAFACYTPILNCSRITNLLTHRLTEKSNIMPSHAENWFLFQPVSASNRRKRSVQSCTHFRVTSDIGVNM